MVNTKERVRRISHLQNALYLKTETQKDNLSG